MKVALIVEWLDAWRGGAETSTQQFIHHLIDLGVELDVFTRSRVSPRPGMAVHTILPSAPARAMKTPAFCRRAGKAAAVAGCDLVHALVPCPEADVYQPRGGTYAETAARNVALRPNRASRLAKRLALRANLKQRRLLALERELLGRAVPPTVLALSDYVVQQLRDHYALEESRIRKVFNGVDPDPASEAERAKNRRDVREMYGCAEDDVVALTVAHNFKLKGVRPLLEALRLLGGRGAPTRLKVLIVGKDRTARWQSLAARWNLDSVVTFCGATQRIRAFYHAADFLVHPTFYDPCSRVVLEAQASGLPVITTRYDGAAETVEEGANGFVLASPDDFQKLADRIAILTDDSARDRMAAAVTSRLGKNDMRSHAERVVAIYEELIREKRR